MSKRITSVVLWINSIDGETRVTFLGQGYVKKHCFEPVTSASANRLAHVALTLRQWGRAELCPLSRGWTATISSQED
jgi:hypothetical protein